MKFGPWRVETRVAQGADSEVYRVSAPDLGVAAVKTVRADRDNTESRARLRLEHALLAQLAHPHIVRPLDGGEAERRRPWFAMAWIDGEECLPWIARNNPEPRDRVLLFDVINHAVAYLHERKIVHGDLVAHNILLSPASMHLTLIDFASALPVDWLLRADSVDEDTRVEDVSLLLGERLSTIFAPDVRALGLLLREFLGEHAPEPYRDVIADCIGDDPHARPADAIVLRQRLLALSNPRGR